MKRKSSSLRLRSFISTVHSHAGPIRGADVHGLRLAARHAVHRQSRHLVHAAKVPTGSYLSEARATQKSTSLHHDTGRHLLTTSSRHNATKCSKWQSVPYSMHRLKTTLWRHDRRRRRDKVNLKHVFIPVYSVHFVSALLPSNKRELRTARNNESPPNEDPFLLLPEDCPLRRAAPKKQPS